MFVEELEGKIGDLIYRHSIPTRRTGKGRYLTGQQFQDLLAEIPLWFDGFLIARNHFEDIVHAFLATARIISSQKRSEAIMRHPNIKSVQSITPPVNKSGGNTLSITERLEDAFKLYSKATGSSFVGFGFAIHNPDIQRIHNDMLGWPEHIALSFDRAWQLENALRDSTITRCKNEDDRVRALCRYLVDHPPAPLP